MIDNRARSVGIARLILMGVVGGVVVYLVREVGGAVLPGARDATSNEAANRATGWLFSLIDLLPAIILLLGVFGIIVLAVFRSEVR